MIDQVNSVNFYAQSKYKEVQEPYSGSFVVPDYTQTGLINEDIFDEPDNVKKKNRVIRIIGGALAAVLLALGCIRGVSKPTSRHFDKLKEYFINRAEETTISSRMVIFYRETLSYMRQLSEKARGFNNFVSFKDIWFKRRITDKVPVLARISRNITKAFDKIGLGVVKASYAKSLKKFNKLNYLYAGMEGEILKDGDKIVTINGVSRTRTEWAEYLAKRRQELMSILDCNFSEKGILKRNHKLKGLMSELGNNVWDASFGTKGKMREKDTYFTFWADKFLEKNKLKYAKGINSVRSKVSFSKADKIRMCNEILDSGKKFIHPQDIASEKVIVEISKLLSEYNVLTKENPARMAELAKEISAKLGEYEKIIEHGRQSFKYDENIISAINEQNNQIRSILTSSKQGCIDEINDIYRALLSDKDYKHVKQATESAVNSLDSAIRKETNDYFDKLRDWTLGAAPTDVLGVLGGFASMGAALALTSDKEKRKSALLKLGIPALGGTAVMMFMTARLTSGLKGFVAGLAASYLLNQLGTFADDKQKEIALAKANEALKSSAAEQLPDKTEQV